MDVEARARGGGGDGADAGSAATGDSICKPPASVSASSRPAAFAATWGGGREGDLQLHLKGGWCASYYSMLAMFV